MGVAVSGGDGEATATTPDASHNAGRPARAGARGTAARSAPVTAFPSDATRMSLPCAQPPKFSPWNHVSKTEDIVNQ